MISSAEKSYFWKLKIQMSASKDKQVHIQAQESTKKSNTTF